MPAWWGRKSGKSKEENQQNQFQSRSPRGNNYGFFKSSNKNDKPKSKDKSNSFDELLARNSPRTSKDLAGSSSGFSGFDSDGPEKRGHPLPRPSVSSSLSLGNDHGVGLGSGSASVSSVSSSGSSEDHPITNEHSQLAVYSGHPDSKFNARSRSPCPGSRGPTSPTSPLHSRLSGLSLESPTGKQEDGKSQCHPLPLPPGSPTSPSTLLNSRTSVFSDNTSVMLSKWKKGKLLGRGSFGHVYVGFNSESGQMCAIKEVRLVSDDQMSKESLKQLHQEINLLSQLSHPNIVRYHGSELADDTLSVYLEYVSGGSIYKLLQDYGPFKEPVIQNYTRQIVSGLAYLHGRNTVHRDIKGANILVDPNGDIKLADFGMAKHDATFLSYETEYKRDILDYGKMILAQYRITNCTSILSFKGSPYWMAPEVVMNTNGYSLAVDIWSLGCTILEMATSKPPWSQYEGVAAIFKIGNSKDIPEIPDSLSHDVKSFVSLCLQRDPSARPTATDLLDHPFIREQSTTRVANINVIKDAFPCAFDGSRTPPHLEPMVTTRALKSPREYVRSMPVSPCSSPLRQYGPAHKSCFLSPPHPSFGMIGQGGYNMNDYSSHPMRHNALYTLDAWREMPLKAQMPGGSPRTRLI